MKLFNNTVSDMRHTTALEFLYNKGEFGELLEANSSMCPSYNVKLSNTSCIIK